ncbi:Stk1 family PASTA domain-containing Ser/Thr kinase [Corynebacterium sanguinis]|uniref:Stk1 family PASTA domain-containing Ser/Thr kinase n=1 Tax=Corynebacterium sanguinis TaxID=2594913 RepID=UPI0021AFB9E7|nr:Stk1 family PASTA domain-containing Ser/Thr kinase [Corynebacterium sanguinis]MCT1695967.1 Stk1 family PASTA domain-containing Ser/Thr kinase [Corynebacterium sanguinis]MCT1715378.1 Stk1 family PASTA domain-containing Ser/Thr kinase [Corynebacterium sanguinis]
MLIGNRYQLGSTIGTGGMSDVYAATDTVLGRDVALKMLKTDMARDESFRERFRREAQNSARLNHPNIVSVYDTGDVDIDGLAVPYIVMERVHGRNLRDIVREDGPLSPQQAAELLIPVTRALQASHDAGIIHRDVKPANIMVTNTGAVKVMDFGIARALDDATSAMTQTSAVIGTAQYLSPEQARGKPADGRSDVYALGCVMYEAVTGRPPFEGETPFAVAYQHVQEEPEAPSTLIDALDNADVFADAMTDTEAVNVDSVILTAMAKHPADRYQSAAEMGADLERLGRGAVTTAARSYLATYDEDPTVVVEPATPVAPVAVAAPAANRYTQHRRANEKQSNNWMKWVAALLGLVLLASAGVLAYNYFTPADTDESTTTPTMLTVPDVTGKVREEAVAELERLGFQVAVNDVPSPDRPRGEVLGTNPVAGSQLQPGTMVTVSVSSGREITDVPDVTGIRPQEAAEVLAGADLELDPEIRRENSDVVPEGMIISQNPAAGSQLSKGSQVSVVVSEGREKVQIPSLVGMNANQAAATLNSLGLNSTVTPVDSRRPTDEVLAVAGENTEVETGTTVELRVSNGMLVAMPDLTRMTPAEAERVLRGTGWNGEFVAGPAVPTGALVDQGLVAGQSVPPDQDIRKDQEIGYNIWRFDAAELIPLR